MQWARLYGWLGHCIVYFDKSVTSCPSDIEWYQNYWKGEDFNRDGSCGSYEGTWTFEYVVNAEASSDSALEMAIGGTAIEINHGEGNDSLNGLHIAALLVGVGIAVLYHYRRKKTSPKSYEFLNE